MFRPTICLLVCATAVLAADITLAVRTLSERTDGFRSDWQRAPNLTAMPGWRPGNSDTGPSAVVDSDAVPSWETDGTDERERTAEENGVRYFPEVLVSDARLADGPLSAMTTEPGTSDRQSLDSEEEHIWKQELSHLSDDDAAQILALRSRIGSIVGPFPGDSENSDKTTRPRGLPAFAMTEARALPAPGETQLVAANAESPVLRHLREHATSVYRENLANRMTPGFKRRELLIVAASLSSQPTEESGDHEESGDDVGENPTWLTRIDLTQGVIRETGNPFDVAISGRGWLRVSDGKTEGFTRSGVLGINDADELGVWTGAGLLPLVPRVSVAAGVELRILLNGVIASGADASEVPVAGQNAPRIVLHTFRNPSALERISSGLYASTASSGEATPRVQNLPGQFVSQALEQSNSNPEREQDELQQLLTVAELIAGQP